MSLRHFTCKQTQLTGIAADGQILAIPRHARVDDKLGTAVCDVDDVGTEPEVVAMVVDALANVLQGIPRLDVDRELFVPRLEGQLAILGDKRRGRAVKDAFLTAGLCQLVDGDIVLTVGAATLALHLQHRVVLVLSDIDGPLVEGAGLAQGIQDIGEGGEGGLELANARQGDIGVVLLGGDGLLQLRLLGGDARRDHALEIDARPRPGGGNRHNMLLLSR
ncbi:hypothetical protein D3C72_903930 [compost metagenome]